MAPTIALVDTIPTLEACLKDISSPETTKLALDIEGVEICRNGKVSILQILANNSNIVWLVDITVLGHLAFAYTDQEGRKLKDILQSPATRKLLFDVRNDADSLYNIFGVDLTNVYDLQILEIAVQRAAGIRVTHLIGLGKTIDKHLDPSAEWKQVKEEGVSLFAPEKGGSYEIFEARPLDPRIMAYSAQDVELLFQLEAVLESKLSRYSSEWKKKVVKFSTARVQEAHAEIYAGRQGKHRILAPKFSVWKNKNRR